MTGLHHFLAKIKFGYFFKILLALSSLYPRKINLNFSDNLRGVAGQHPFSVNVENICIIPVLVSNEL